MSSKAMRVFVLVMVAVIGSVVRSEAASITISPASQTANIGDAVSVDILVALGAGEEVGAFSLILSYNPAILLGIGFIANPDGAMGAGTDLSFGFNAWGPGTLDLFYSAEDFPPVGPGGDEAALQALQGAGFRLARVSFTAVGNGISPLALSVFAPNGVFLSDGLGVTLQSISTDGQVCVGADFAGRCDQQPNPTIPEPGTLTLLGLGASALVARRRRARAAK